MRFSLVTRSLLIIGAAIFLFGGPSTAQELRGKHRDQVGSCALCHETDNPTRAASSSTCRTCHERVDTPPRNLIVGGKIYAFNPHKSHQGEQRCTICHKVHRPSVLLCKDCHAFEVNVP